MNTSIDQKKNHLLLIPSAILLWILTSCYPSPHRIYVVPDYDAKNFEQAALGSIKAALDSVKRFNETNDKGPVQILLYPGVYNLMEPIVFTEAHSGTESGQLVIKPAADGEVVVSGAMRLDLKWIQVKDSLWKADLAIPVKIDQLFLDGKKQVRARYPDYDSTISIYNGYAPDAIDPERIARWEDPSTGVLHAMHRAEWGGYHYQIEGLDGEGNARLNGGYQNNRQMGLHPKYRYVENIREELNAPGEWFYDKKQEQLFYIANSDMDLNSMRVEVPFTENLIYFSGTEEEPVHDIQWKNCTFRYTQYTFMKTDEPLLRSDWKIHRGGAVLLEGTENISIENNRFDYLGGNGVFVSGYNRNSEISGNHFSEVGGSGICFVGRPEAVRSPAFEYHDYVKWENLDRERGPKTNEYPSKCIAFDNLIHDIGKVEKQVAGVQISMASDITVRHNSIYNVPRAGINISEGTWGGHIIEYNDVFNTVLETGDHGAFNSWGRDRFWHPNRERMNEITDSEPSLILADAVDTTIIRHNRFRCDHGWDIDLDDGSSLYKIYNNLCLNGGIKLREGFYRKVENNIMVNNTFHPHVWFKNSQDIFRYNIVGMAYKPIRVAQWGEEVDFNLLPDSADLARMQEFGLDKNSLYGDPHYLDPATGNYQVAATSPALKVGFVNFSMDEFGVISKHLKEIAAKPDFPQPYPVGKEGSDRTFKFLGADVKKLIGIGEQSATGLDRERGILVVNIPPEKSIARVHGLLEGDVILALNETPTNSIRRLMEVYQGEVWKGRVELTVYRNQKEMKKVIQLSD